MGILTTQSGNITNMRYSAFLGMLYISTPANEALIKEAKALVGESEVKKGYQGSKGDSASAKALQFLREKGLYPIRVCGNLVSARVMEREVEGRIHPYLHVGLRDDDGKYFLSVALGTSSAQMLARKLANADVDALTEINLFATFGQREGASRPYANHGASLKQRGIEVKSIDPKKSLMPAIEAAMKSLEEAGISKETDKETFTKRRHSVELKFHTDLMNMVNQKFTDFHQSTEIENPSDDEALALAYSSIDEEFATV